MRKLSRDIGMNDAYMQQFIKEGKPYALPEEVRYELEKVLNIPQKLFRFPIQQSFQKISGIEPINDGDSHESVKHRYRRVSRSKGAHHKASSGQSEMEIGDIEEIISGQADRSREIVLPRNIPVRATSATNSNADFELSRQVIDYVGRPPGLAHAKDVFAIYVVGSTMEPRYEEGEMVYVNPKRPAKVGDYVIIEMLNQGVSSSSECLIKKLVSRTDSELILSQFNPQSDDIRVSVIDIKAVHRIMQWSEVLGN